MDAYKEKYPEEHDELTRRIASDMPINFEESYKNFLNECNEKTLQWQQENLLKYV